MSNRTHSKVSKQISINREVVSDSELDSILEEVEKIQQNKLKVERQSFARKSAGDTSHLFTKEDEKTLKEIFNNVEKRQKEFEEMNLVRAASSSCGGKVRRDSISSNSSQDSLDSQSDDELSSPVSSSAESTDNSSDDSEPNATNIKTQYTRKSSMTRKSSKTEKNFPKSNIENTGKSSTVGDKTNETVKLRRRKSKIKASNTS